MQNILAIILPWTSRNLFRVAWKQKFELGIHVSLHLRPIIARAICDPLSGQLAAKAFTRGGALGPVNANLVVLNMLSLTFSLRTLVFFRL